MLKLIAFLWFGHSHKWKIIDRVKLYRSIKYTLDENVRPVGEDFICQCEKCGKVRTFRT